MDFISSELFYTIAWLVVVVIAVMYEISTVQLVSIWFALGALVSAICAAFGCPIYLQLVIFASISVVCIILTRPIVKKMNAKKQAISGTAEGLVDEIVTVTKPVTHDITGEVKAKYDYYNAISVDNSEFTVGEKAQVVELSGNKMIIKKIEKE